MELTEDNRLKKQQRAKKKIKELKGFFNHLIPYIIVNTCLPVSKIINNMYNGETFYEAFWDFSTFAVWLFWGIGVFFHGAKVFSFNPFFNKKWEERQMKKYMEEETFKEGKYR